MTTIASSKNKFIMICGLPGSGKTYLARSLTDPDTVWISSDRIREEFYGSESEQGDPGSVFDEMLKRTSASLNEGKNVLYDACNISSKHRSALLRQLNRHDCLKQCIICATPYETCMARNGERNRVVEDYVIKRMYMNWYTPYYHEGWDEISIHYSDGSRNSAGKVSDFIDKFMDYDQETPYHKEKLGDHLLNTGSYLIERYGYDQNHNMVLTGLIHDCGKPFTKGFKDSRGNPCDIAHYYQHQCVGAYDSLFFDYGDKSDEDILEISNLVGLHMSPFNWKEEKTGEKYKRLWGDELYSKVMQIHEADEAATE